MIALSLSLAAVLGRNRLSKTKLYHFLKNEVKSFAELRCSSLGKATHWQTLIKH